MRPWQTSLLTLTGWSSLRQGHSNPQESLPTAQFLLFHALHTPQYQDLSHACAFRVTQCLPPAWHLILRQDGAMTPHYCVQYSLASSQILHTSVMSSSVWSEEGVLP